MILPMKKQAIMFDLDGTLLDTLEDLGDTMNLTLREQGLPEHPYAFYRHAVGDGARMLARRALPESRRDDATADASLEAMKRHYETTWNRKTRPYDGILDVLETLHAQGVALAILSNKPDGAVQRCVDYFLPTEQFRIVQGVLPGVPIKPDPEGALSILKKTNIPAEAWLYVGDTDTDMQTAVAAGLFAVGCTWGFRDRDELLSNGADAIIDHPSELLPLLDNAHPSNP
jgi:phosphoglycolate phosphatase